MWRKQASFALGGLALVIMASGCGTAARDTTFGVRPGPAAPAAASALPGNAPPGVKDGLFVAEAAHGSASEIELSRVALDRAKSQEVKDYARMVLEDHRKASQQLMDLAQRKGHPTPSQPSADVLGRTAALQRSAADSVDRDYMQRMVDDHTRTLAMFRDVARSSQDPDVRAWAGSQVPALEAHLTRAQALNDSLTKTAAAK